MRFRIVHEIKGRMRIHVSQKRMSYEEADTLQYYLESQSFVLSAKVYERNQDVAVCYEGSRQQLIALLQRFQYEEVQVPDSVLAHSGRELNREYWDKLVGRVVRRMASKCFLPYSVRTVITTVKSVKYIWKGICTLAKGKIEVPVLDGTAIAVSVFRGDFATASSVMFLLGIGEILEDWTHKKSVGDLARSMSLNVSKVWLVTEEGREVLVDANTITAGDRIVVHMGNVIPFDGKVSAGEGAVNQSSLTGEGLPVMKAAGGFVYAGTVLEEGELTIEVKEVSGSTKFEKIVTMIEESQVLCRRQSGSCSR